jgi:hypothetical protein
MNYLEKIEDIDLKLIDFDYALKDLYQLEDNTQ